MDVYFEEQTEFLKILKDPTYCAHVLRVEARCEHDQLLKHIVFICFAQTAKCLRSLCIEREILFLSMQQGDNV